MQSPPSQSQPPSHEQTKRTGRMMMTIAWVIGLFLLTRFFGQWQDRQYNPNVQPQSQHSDGGRIQVSLQRNRQGHYVTQGTINQRPFTFLLDTGATDIVVPEAIANRLHLPHLGRGWASTANGEVQIEQTRLDSVSIGDIVLYNVRASINPGMGNDSEILFGMSALRQLEFRQKDGVLTLIQN